MIVTMPIDMGNIKHGKNKVNIRCVKEINFISKEQQGSGLCNYHLNKKKKAILCFIDPTKNLSLLLIAQLRNL